MQNKYAKYRSINGYNYFVIDYIQKNCNKDKKYKVLQIGCNTGYNLSKIKQILPNSYTVGIDILNIQPEEGVDQFLCKNIETDTLPFSEYQFDIILCCDILEHLSDPYAIVKQLKYCLKQDGLLFASIPNLMYFSVLYNLIKYGTFTYTETGILDSDHKHFFTYYEIEKMFEKYFNDVVIYSQVIEPKFQGKHFIHQLQAISLLPEIFYTTFQYYIIVKN